MVSRVNVGIERLPRARLKLSETKDHIIHFRNLFQLVQHLRCVGKRSILLIRPTIDGRTKRSQIFLWRAIAYPNRTNQGLELATKKDRRA